MQTAGAKVVHTTTSGGGGITPPAGDIGGNTASPTVVGLRGVALSATPATAGQAYVLTGGIWVPASVVQSVTQGDGSVTVGGSATAPTVQLPATGPGVTGPIGSGTTVPVVTIDAKGRITALTSTAITAGGNARTAGVLGANYTTTGGFVTFLSTGVLAISAIPYEITLTGIWLGAANATVLALQAVAGGGGAGTFAGPSVAEVYPDLNSTPITVPQLFSVTFQVTITTAGTIAFQAKESVAGGTIYATSPHFTSAGITGWTVS